MIDVNFSANFDHVFQGVMIELRIDPFLFLYLSPQEDAQVEVRVSEDLENLSHVVDSFGLNIKVFTSGLTLRSGYSKAKEALIIFLISYSLCVKTSSHP